MRTLALLAVRRVARSGVRPLSQAAPQVGSYIGISGSEFDRSGA